MQQNIQNVFFFFRSILADPDIGRREDRLSELTITEYYLIEKNFNIFHKKNFP